MLTPIMLEQANSVLIVCQLDSLIETYEDNSI